MQLTLHDANLKILGWIDNVAYDTLSYSDDLLTKDLPTGASTYRLKIPKRKIKSDLGTDYLYKALNERAWITFVYRGKVQLFSIRDVIEDRTRIELYCEDLNAELLNEYANPYSSSKELTFAQYCEAMELLQFSFLKIGRNEISNEKLSLEFANRETKLARIIALARAFGAEFEFTVRLNPNSSIKDFILDVYHGHDDKYHGVGTKRNDLVLNYSNGLRNIRRKVSKKNIFNMIVPIGKRSNSTKNKKTVTNNPDGTKTITEKITFDLTGMPDWSKKTSDGVLEFYKRGAALYAPISAQLYPSTFTSETGKFDQWTRRDMEFEADSEEELNGKALAELEKYCYPEIIYELDGYIDGDIGDTVIINDTGFDDMLTITARITKQQISFTNPKSNKTEIANVRAVNRMLSSGMQNRLNRIIEETKPYTIQVTTDNGVMFKNGVGTSLVTPILVKGVKEYPEATWRFTLNGETTVGLNYLVSANQIEGTQVLTIAAYIGNEEIATHQLTFANVTDGKQGKAGTSSYTYWAYSAHADGHDMTEAPNAETIYAGQCVTDSKTRPSDYRLYTWSKIKGDKGPKGNDAAINLTAGFTDGYPLTFVPVNKGVGSITSIGDGWAHVEYTNDTSKDTSKDVRVEFYLPKPEGLTEGQIYTFLHEYRNNKSSPDTGSYHVIENKSAFSGNTALPDFNSGGNATTYHRNGETRIARQVALGTNVKLSDTTELVRINTYVAPGKSVNFDMRISCYAGIYDGPYVPYQGGRDGNGIANVEELYLVSSQNTGITTRVAGWSTTVPVMTAQNKYLWNYTKTTYTDGTVSSTAPAVIGSFGADGATGKGIQSITEYYLASAQSTGITTSTAGWTTTMQPVSVDKKYLWNYSVTRYTDNSTQTSQVLLIGAYGDTGKFDGTIAHENLLQNSDFEEGSNYWTLINSTIDSGVGKISGKMNSLAYIRQTITDQIKKFPSGTLFYYSFDIKVTDIVYGSKNPCVKFYADGTYSNSGVSTWVGATYTPVQLEFKDLQNNAWVRVTGAFKVNAPHEQLLSYYYHIYARDFTGDIEVKKIKLQVGDLATDWSLSAEDIKRRLSNKTDDALMQQKMLEIQEKNDALENEIKARLSQQALLDWAEEYDKTVTAATDEAKKKAEESLVQSAERLAEVTKLGEKAIKLETKTGYLQADDNGLTITKDGSDTKFIVTNDVISFVSGGKAVMTLTKGELKIDNGVFALSVRVGRFVESPLESNPDINVVRYVGEVR